MSGSYQSAVARMYALGHELAHTPSHKFDLEHMQALLEALEHPEKKFPSVLIAGTNGKGSTAATLASILQAAGLCTGLYTSPHLVRINERIRINGEQIPDDQFALLHGVVDRTAERLVEDAELPRHPSFFEMLTAIAFEHFANRKVDIAVLEVGMVLRVQDGTLFGNIHRWTWIPGWLSLLAHRARRKGRESDLADSALCSDFDSLYQTHPGSNQCGRSSNHLPRQRLPANHLLDLRSFVRGKHPALARPERVRAEPGS